MWFKGVGLFLSKFFVKKNIWFIVYYILMFCRLLLFFRFCVNENWYIVGIW